MKNKDSKLLLDYLNSKNIKHISIVLSIIAALLTIFYTLFDNSEINVEGNNGNTIVGNNNTILQHESPRYRIEMSGERFLTAGDSLSMSAGADQNKFLKNIHCHWTITENPKVVLDLQQNDCNLAINVKSVSIDINTLTINTELSITRNGELYSVRDEFSVRPDYNSEEYLKAQKEKIKLQHEKIIKNAQKRIDSIMPDLQDLQFRTKRQSITYQLLTYKNRIIRCSATGCNIKIRELCEANVTAINFGKKSGEWLTNYLVNCKEVGEDNPEFCIYPGADLFGLTPGMQLFGQVQFSNGTDAPFSQKILNRTNHFDSLDKDWVQLHVTDKSKFINAPFAALKFESAQNNLVVYIATGQCDYKRAEMSIAYDVDGKGFIDSGKRNPFNIIEPKSNQIQILITMDGSKYGPFNYTFDKKNFITQLSKKLPAPKLTCQHISQQSVCKIHEKDSMLSWASVSRLRYGESKKQLDKLLTINVPETEVFKNIRSSRLKEYQITLPNSWSDLYYQIEYENGNSRPVTRIPL